jgi:hypothetical protein
MTLLHYFIKSNVYLQRNIFMRLHDYIYLKRCLEDLCYHLAVQVVTT